MFPQSKDIGQSPVVNEAAAGNGQAQQAGRKKVRVLLADANEQLAEIYRYFLASRGHAVEVAHSDLDCLVRLRQNRPEILVLDLDLVRSGWAGVLVWLRAPEHGPAPAILLTATDDARDALAAVGLPPVAGCLRKPFDLDALVEGVRVAAAPVAVVS